MSPRLPQLSSEKNIQQKKRLDIWSSGLSNITKENLLCHFLKSALFLKYGMACTLSCNNYKRAATAQFHFYVTTNDGTDLSRWAFLGCQCSIFLVFICQYILIKYGLWKPFHLIDYFLGNKIYFSYCMVK